MTVLILLRNITGISDGFTKFNFWDVFNSFLHFSANSGNTDPPKKRAAQRIREEKMLGLVKDFDKKSALDYLESLAPYMKQN